MFRRIILSFALFLSVTALKAQVLPLREQARWIDDNTADRLNTLLPEIMKRSGIDMWVLISREYNEDPALRTLLPATWLSARRRTILVFFRDPKTGEVEKMAVARYDVGDRIKASWDMKKFPKQWDAVADIIATRKPEKIGLNLSKDFAHADGLDHTDYQEFMEALPTAYKSRVVSAEPIAVPWLETRNEREMAVYPQLTAMTHAMIAEAFSEKVITPGITTTDDVVWWLREKIRSMGLDTWFHPSVSAQRSDSLNFEHLRNFSNRPADDVIRPGDLLHVDFGITYLRLNTDVQEHAYVLKPGETDVPASLQLAFKNANRLQDILTSQFAEGVTGNQALSRALAQAQREGITASIYTHPLGFHGHAAGATIGMWDMQQGVPGAGDYPIHANTVWSIELNAATRVPEWGKEVRIMLEEDGFYGKGGFRFINGRQKSIFLIPRPAPNQGN